MNVFARWAAICAAGIAAFGALVLAFFYVASERVIGATYPLPPSSFHAASGGEAIARGKHLAFAYGCGDCHYKNLQGGFVEFAGYKSRNLTRLAKTFSDADFERVLHHGIRPDGTSVGEAMPSDAYQFMPNADLADILAYLRSLPAAGDDIGTPEYTLQARYNLAVGKDHTDRYWFTQQKPALDLGPKYAHGRMMAMTACGECHMTALTGATHDLEGVRPPDLSLVASYSREDFLHFMHTGKAAGNRELPLMSEMARDRFSHFSDAELTEIYEYLAARGRKLNGG